MAGLNAVQQGSSEKVRFRRSSIRFLIKAGLSAAALYLLAVYANIELVLESLGAADWRWVLAAIALGCGIVLVNGFRWSRISASLSSPLPPRFSVLTYAEGLFFAMITPAAIGGDVVRVARSTRAFGRIRENMAAVLLDRAVNLISMVVLAALALPFTTIEEPAIRSTVLGLFLLISLLAALPYLALATLRQQRMRRQRAAREALRLAIMFRRFLGNARGSVEIAGLSSVVLLLAMGIMLSAARAVGAVELGLAQAATAFSLALLVAAVPVSVAGLGPREGVMIWTLVELGIDAGQAYAIAILFTAAFLASALPGLVIWLSGINRIDGGGPDPATGCAAAARPAAEGPRPRSRGHATTAARTDREEILLKNTEP
ncbi:MAG: lysylphosphatidylglycerol synthase transmembrane domain-containing protein [Kiloniellales bacterium]|nr:lysylphosphatidylglycerol synthase transmembrane domain-containing protein [Kiloniellales bacterium]